MNGNSRKIEYNEFKTYRGFARMPLHNIRREHMSQISKLISLRSLAEKDLPKTSHSSQRTDDRLPSSPCKSMLRTHLFQEATVEHSSKFDLHPKNLEPDRPLMQLKTQFWRLNYQVE